MRILQLEASNGWGGQEIRTLQEAVHMRSIGHKVVFAVAKGSLASKAKELGFKTYVLPYQQRALPLTLFQLLYIILREKIDSVHTHSSWDGWVGGFAGKLLFKKVIRTRHLSTPIRPGLNSTLLYNRLADVVVTTCQEVAEQIQRQAELPPSRCLSIPTGVNPHSIEEGLKNRYPFRELYQIPEDAFLVGCCAVWRSWKGLMPLVKAVGMLGDDVYLALIGEGPMRPHLEKAIKEANISHRVRLIGYLSNPFPAIESLDLFALLSTANEGVSQASLQAAYLGKPLLTTPTGGLKEVCLPGKTGLIVPVNNPEATAAAIQSLKSNPELKSLGKAARHLVESQFLWKHTSQKLELIEGNY